MTYKLGPRSIKELEGVHPTLVAMVEKAIEISDQDFTVVDGLRTVEEQREYVARGVSKTMESKHLPQADGYGHAVDLVPWINGKPRWELDPCMVIGQAMRMAASSLGVGIVWGGCWLDIAATDETLSSMNARYVVRCQSMGRRAFIDGPHYELLD